MNNEHKRSLPSPRLTVNFSLLSASSIVQGVLGFLTVAALARRLGPGTYGLYSYTSTWVLLVVPLVQIGIPGWMTRQAAQFPQPERALMIQEAWNILFWIGLVCMGVFAGGVSLLPISGSVKLLLWIWSPILAETALNPLWLYALSQSVKIPAAAVTGGAVLRLVCTLWLIHRPDQVDRAVLITMGSLMVTMVIPVIHLMARHVIKTPYMPTPQGLIAMIRHAIGFAWFGLASVFYAGIDIVILRQLSTLTQVGWYTAANRPVVFLGALSAAFLQTFFPAASRLKHDNPRQLQQLTLNILRLLFIVAIPLIMGTVMVSHDLTVAIFGIQYQGAVPALTLLVCAWAIRAIREVLAVNLVVRGKEKQYLRLILGAGVINAGIMLALVHWGATGVAMALIITQVVVLSGTVRALHEGLVGFKTLSKPIAWSIVNGAIMAACIHFLIFHLVLWLAIGIGIMVYMCLSFGERIVTWNDIVAIWHT